MFPKNLGINFGTFRECFQKVYRCPRITQKHRTVEWKAFFPSLFQNVRLENQLFFVVIWIRKTEGLFSAPVYTTLPKSTILCMKSTHLYSQKGNFFTIRGVVLKIAQREAPPEAKFQLTTWASNPLLYFAKQPCNDTWSRNLIFLLSLC